MSALWVVPLLFIATGAVLLGMAARRTAEAGDRLREECAHLEELRSVLATLRTEAGAARSTLDRVRTRSESETTRS